MKNEKQILEQLEQHRTTAPNGFADRVMNELPAWRKAKRSTWWPRNGLWIAPALTGAVAALLILLGITHTPSARLPDSSQVTFHFELHAPGADRVELLGTFNNWKSGDIVLTGPDASGHFIASVEIPEGRHEYIFLVDGERWLADPKAATHRPDGFGRVNTIIKVYDNETA